MKQKQIVFPLLELGSQVGAQKQWRKKVVLPSDIGTDDLAVPKGTEIDLDIYAIALQEGVSVSVAGQTLALGECVCCLRSAEREIKIEGNRIYYYPDALERVLAELDGEPADESIDEAYQLDNSGVIDLEPLLIDMIIPQFPYRVLCDEECEGLCSDCGVPWDELPADHEHEVFDRCWGELANFFSKSNQKDSE